MTDDSRVRDGQTVDASAFLDWLDEMAATEGTSREELIQTLVSSYWTLDEMFRLMEQADPDSELPALGDPEALDGPVALPGQRGEPAHGDLAERVGALAERVESLEATLADVQQTSPAVDGELDALAGELEAVEAALRDDHGELRDRVDTEFGHLHAILEHLIEATDGLHGRADRLESRLEDGVRGLLSSQERLTGLKRTAAQIGARSAKCGYCGTEIDVALLPTPDCPQCDRRFQDVEPKRGWFGSATLNVESRAAAERSGPESIAGDEDAGAPDAGRSRRSDEGADAPAEFDWIGEDD